MKETITLRDKVFATDPCYESHLWCVEKIDNILPGIWKVSVEKGDYKEWGVRIASLTIKHESFKTSAIEDDFSEYISSIGVDSGQCGFFDAEYYKENQPDDNWENKNSWYRRVCDITLGESRWGTIEDKGAVSESGWI